jgi:hypothetical protein
LSALNTRRNPDILLPGGVFLKGNMYFKSNVTKEKGIEEDVEEG